MSIDNEQFKKLLLTSMTLEYIRITGIDNIPMPNDPSKLTPSIFTKKFQKAYSEIEDHLDLEFPGFLPNV